MSEGTIGDAETEVLERLAGIRAAISGQVAEQTTVEGLRAALLALFSGFTVRDPGLASERQLDALIRADLFPAGAGLVVEPHVRPEAIAGGSPDLPGVEVHRVPLSLAVTIESAPTPPE